MIPYVAVIFFNDNPQILGIMSYVPFSAPVGMPMRIYLGIAEWWEPLLSLAVLIASIAVVWWFGARVYRGVGNVEETDSATRPREQPPRQGEDECLRSRVAHCVAHLTADPSPPPAPSHRGSSHRLLGRTCSRPSIGWSRRPASHRCDQLAC